MCIIKPLTSRRSSFYTPYNTINVNRFFPLAPFAANAARELYILGHYRDPFRVDGAQICILKETNEICLRSMLQGEDSG